MDGGHSGRNCSGIKTISIGAFWRVFDAWVNRYPNASIKISYRTQDDKLVEVTDNVTHEAGG